jgi:hypothetical protein
LWSRNSFFCPQNVDLIVLETSAFQTHCIEGHQLFSELPGAREIEMKVAPKWGSLSHACPLWDPQLDGNQTSGPLIPVSVYGRLIGYATGTIAQNYIPANALIHFFREFRAGYSIVEACKAFLFVRNTPVQDV